MNASCISPTEVKKILQDLKQDALLATLEKLGPVSQESLWQQLGCLDWNVLKGLLGNLNATSQESSSPIAPIHPYEVASTREATLQGEEMLRAGKLAAFTVAGGQGSRLGYEGPKGCFGVTPVRKASLFQVFAEKILAAQKLYGTVIPWVLMTSPQNDGPTKEFFKKNQFFGLSEDQLFFFIQGVMPSVDAKTGALLLESPDKLVLSPDGTGGSLTGLCRSGALDWLLQKGIQYLSYFQVDNPLVKIVDPYFLGVHMISGSEFSSKATPKRDPLEKVGVFAHENGVLKIVEYSYMPQALALARDSKGDILYRWGNTAVHLLNLDFIGRMGAPGSAVALPYSRALKKIAYWENAPVTPTSPNAIKFEQFIFDALPLAKNSIVVAIHQPEEFSPVKNATGNDSPETSMKDQMKLWATWLKEAGVSVPLKDDGSPAITFEITPLFADTKEAFLAQAKAARVPANISNEMVL